MDFPESQNEKDARVKQLWNQLDPATKGEIDFQGLEKGLKKIKHPLRNAHGLLQEVMKAIDKNGDSKISYEEFRTFVEETESQLYTLFKQIDVDHNGQLDKEELKAAFKRAGLSVTPKKLDHFFAEFDQDESGAITFDEWRDFLLFLPTARPGLKAVLSYYSSTVTLNAEGDTQLSDENVESLGTAKFLSILLGSIIRIARPDGRGELSTKTQRPQIDLATATPSDTPAIPERMAATAHSSSKLLMDLQRSETPILVPALSVEPIPKRLSCFRHIEPDFNEDVDVIPQIKHTSTDDGTSLTSLYDPGYFAAGGIAGVISRTSTAPLDRLKVYLIAKTDVKESIKAAKKRGVMNAVRHFAKPLIDATKELWKAGGVRSLFAGNGLNVIKVMPESAIKFGSYEGAKRALARLEGHGDTTNINPYSKFVAGGLGGMASQLCVYPLDTLKFRMQCNVEAKGLHGNALILATAKKMYLDGGFRAAYRGLTMGMMGMFPYAAIDLGTFEFLKSTIIAYNAKAMNLPEDHDDVYPGSLATGCIGAFSGAFGASVVYPLNLLRTRLQAQGTILHPQTYTGVVDCAKKTVGKEGIHGLYKGLTPNLLKVVPAVSITYVVYENSKRILKLH